MVGALVGRFHARLLGSRQRRGPARSNTRGVDISVIRTTTRGSTTIGSVRAHRVAGKKREPLCSSAFPVTRLEQPESKKRRRNVPHSPRPRLYSAPHCTLSRQL